MHVYKCMQIQIAFRQYNNLKLSSSLRSLEVKLHVYICCFFSIEIICFDFNAFHIKMQMYKCMRAYACMHTCVCVCVCVCACMHAHAFIHMCVHACVYVHFAIHPPPKKKKKIDVGLSGYPPPPPPHNIEKLPTPMIYMGHVQNGAIFCCNAWATQRIWGGGGAEFG